jgi:O-antigen ligase
MYRPGNVLRGTPARAGLAAARPQSAAERQYSLLFAGLLWVLILYSAIPLDIFNTNTNTDPTVMSELQMAVPNPVSRAIKLSLLAIAMMMILWRRSVAMKLLKTLNPMFRVFMVLAPLSLVWSIDPGATFARYVTLFSMVTVCFAFGLGGWHAHRFQSVLRPVLTLILLGSLIYGIVSPELAIDLKEGSLKGSWHGLMIQKNQFGQAGSFGVLLWLHAFMTRQTKILYSVFGGAVSAACLFLSRSQTSLLATVFASVLMVMMFGISSSLRRYVPYIVATFATVVIIYALAVLKIVPGLDVVLRPITVITGKDMTFSNRSEIWLIVKEHIQLSPFIGTGYGAYWVGPLPTSPSFVFLSRMYFYPTESHNGYLEMVNDLGFIGLIVLLGYLFVYVRQSLQLLRIDRPQAALFLSLFFQQLIINLSETAWLSTTGAFTTAVMTCATVSLARSLLDSRRQNLPAARPRRVRA